MKKVSMNFSERTLNNVDILSKMIGESNRTRVIASAIEIAKTILEQKNSGKQIIIRSDEGYEQTINFIFT
jgi:metal-responsive CopG/Arc/MetJ family transcriptional regulator